MVCKIEMEKVAVLPVPDCALKDLIINYLTQISKYTYCAMTSLPFTIGSIALCWIAEGFSNPENNLMILLSPNVYKTQ